MSTLWKAWLISFQIYLVPSQYHIGKASKLPIYYVAISGESYTVVMRLLDILGTQAQVGARPKKMENTKEMALDVHLLGHHLSRPARMSKPSQRPSPIRVRVCLGHQYQSAIKRMPRTYPNSVFDDPHIDGNII
jgi:hypothetical protein